MCIRDSSCVGLRALASYRQALAVTDTAVAADFNESLDIERNITAEVALNGVVVVDICSQLCSVIFRKISYADVRINARSSADVRR